MTRVSVGLAVILLFGLGWAACSLFQDKKDIRAGYEAKMLTCPVPLGGARYQRPCDAQFESSSLNVKVKADVLQKGGLEIGVDPKKLQEVSDKTMNTVAWLRDLCADWNACGIEVNQYQARKEKLILIEDNFYRLSSRLEEIKQAPGTKGPSDPAIKEYEAMLDAHRKVIDQLGAELGKK